MIPRLLPWLVSHRRSLVGGLILLYVARMLTAAWRNGDLSTLSFVILGFVALFELGCCWVLLRGFSAWEDDEYEQGLISRKAANRLPRKRFGNAPKGM